MQTSPLRIAAFVIPVLLLAPAAFARPSYPATSGSVSYTNSVFGCMCLDNSFSFSGPMMSIAGSGVTLAQPPFENLGVPFNLTLGLIIDDNGDESGSAIGNGISYPSVQFVGGAGVQNSIPMILTAGHLTVSVPATLNGLITVCSPNNFCANGGGPFSDVFDVPFALSGTLTASYAQFNVGSPYALTNAVFTTGVPEPSSLALLGGGVLVFTRVLRRKLS